MNKMNRASVSFVATDKNDIVSGLKFQRRPSTTVDANGNTRRRSSVLKDVIVFKHFEFQGSDEDLAKYEELEVEYTPDGGWMAWIVAIASLLNNFVLDGVSFSYGVLEHHITASGTMEGWEFHLCGSVMLGTTLVIGPIVSTMANRWGFRIVSMAGSIIAGLGFCLSWAASPELPQFLPMLLGFGILGGIGFGCMFTTSIVVLGKFFQQNLPLATGIGTTGSAVGSIVMPIVLEKISQSWGWQGSFLFLGGCCFVSVIFGALYFPPPRRMEKVKIVETSTDWKDIKELLSSPTFWILGISGGIVVLGYFGPSNFLSDRAQGPPFNATAENAAYLPSIIGGSNTIGRIFFAILANSDRAVYSLLMTNVVVTIGGIASIASVYATEYWMLVLYSFIFGQMLAVYACLRSIIVYQLVGKDKFNLAFGVSLFFMGISLYFGNTFTGWLKTYSGDYSLTFHYIGAFFILSAVLCYPLPWIYKYEMSKRPRRFSTVSVKSNVI